MWEIKEKMQQETTCLISTCNLYTGFSTVTCYTVGLAPPRLGAGACLTWRRAGDSVRVCAWTAVLEYRQM